MPSKDFPRPNKTGAEKDLNSRPERSEWTSLRKRAKTLSKKATEREILRRFAPQNDDAGGFFNKLLIRRTDLAGTSSAEAAWTATRTTAKTKAEASVSFREHCQLSCI